MNFTCGGGSSRVFKRALKECDESMCTSSMMKILKRLLSGRCATGLHQVAHLIDLGVRGAVDFENVESRALADLLAVGAGVARLRRRALLAVEALASSRAVVVLPTPRGPVKRKACATRPAAMAAWQGAGHVILPDHVREALRP